MEEVVEVDTLPQAGINDRLRHLTQQLQKANPLGVSFTLGYKD